MSILVLGGRSMHRCVCLEVVDVLRMLWVVVEKQHTACNQG